MQRITITIEQELLAIVDVVMQRRGYGSRSEALRDMIRDAVTREAVSAATMPCIAVLSYVYDHDTRALAQRLTHALHDHHDLSVAGLHVHLNHESCLEVSVLKGAAASVHDLADALTAQRGVRHANLHLLPAQISTARHDHGAGSVAHQHIRA